MKKMYVITEGKSESALLRALLPDHLIAMTGFVSTKSASDAKSLARSLAGRRGAPVAVVLNSESLALEASLERKGSIERAVSSVAGPVPIKVIFAIPEMDAIFFHNEEVLTRILGKRISYDILQLAEEWPAFAIEKLIAESPSIGSRANFMARLTSQDIEELRKTGPVNEMITFLEHALDYSARWLNTV